MTPAAIGEFIPFLSSGGGREGGRRRERDGGREGGKEGGREGRRERLVSLSVHK